MEMGNKEVLIHETELIINENNEIISVPKLPVVEDEEDGIIVIPEGAISMAQHARHYKKVTGHIHKRIPVIRGVLVRARKSNRKDELVDVYTEQFTTLGSNNPNAYVLMKANGDFDKVDPITVNITKWDEKKRKLVKSITVTCHEKSPKDGKKYIFTNTQVLVCYGYLENDIRRALSDFEMPEEEITKTKDKIIDSIIRKGLVLDPKDNRYKPNDGKIKRGHFLTPLYWSPSGCRNENKLFTPLRADQAFDALDKAAGGALSEACLGKITVEKIIKLSARIGILGAPSIKMADMANKDMAIVIWNGKIQGPSDYSEADAKKIEESGMTIDTWTLRPPSLR